MFRISQAREKPGSIVGVIQFGICELAGVLGGATKTEHIACDVRLHANDVEPELFISEANQ
jgi:hypothetical protein